MSGIRSRCLVLALVAAAWVGCSDDDAEDPARDDAAADGGGRGADREDAAAPLGSDAGVRRDAGPAPAGNPSREDGGRSDAAADAENPELPEGSVERDGIVNLVDDAAAAQLEEFLSSNALKHVALREGLTEPVNLFLAHYREAYDFIVFFTDRTLPGATIGKFEPVNVRAAPGGAGEIELALGGYRSSGRLKGVIGIQWRTPVGPPLAHELMHYWAVHLDTRLGFGVQGGAQDPTHWGFTSVHGQLGGFDADELRCETPSGASPPGCTALGGGRVRYVVPQFFPSSNPAAPYAPLELYLMGLVPKSEVPAVFRVLEGAELVPNSFDAATRTVIVEAAGLGEIAFADVLARHGEVVALPEDERAFTAAFVVISPEPAPDQVLADVAEWAAAFGNRGSSQVVTAFETLTGGRATLDTSLGPRRPASDPLPEPRKRLGCDVLAQDCARDGLGCYGLSVPVCALAGSVAQGAPCDSAFGCQPGSDCVSAGAGMDSYVCAPYCHPDDASHAKSCQTLCTGDFVRVRDAQQQTLGAFCAP